MHRCATWIACFAILLASLAPSISHAVNAARGAPNAWVEICTVDGSKMMQVDNDRNPHSPAEKAMHFEHCPFCLSHAVSPALLPTADFVIPVIEGSAALPLLFYQASHPLFAWTASQPRAPPAFS